jgi:hypothetical protein
MNTFLIKITENKLTSSLLSALAGTLVGNLRSANQTNQFSVCACSYFPVLRHLAASITIPTVVEKMLLRNKSHFLSFP